MRACVRATVLQIAHISVPAEVDAEWNAWYSGEYVPGYRKVPGVIYARRYRVLEGTSGYTTVYEFASTAVPESAAWKEQQQHSSPNSLRMRQAMTHAPGSAGVYTRIDPQQAPRGCRELIHAGIDISPCHAPAFSPGVAAGATLGERLENNLVHHT